MPIIAMMKADSVQKKATSNIEINPFQLCLEKPSTDSPEIAVTGKISICKKIITSSSLPYLATRLKGNA